jgi:hypothetical protein
MSELQAVDDYVWAGLSPLKWLVGREAVDSLVRSSMHCPLIGSEGASRYVYAQAKKEGSLGAILLSWVLPYVIAEVVKLVAAWLAKRESVRLLPRIHG